SSYLLPRRSVQTQITAHAQQIQKIPLLPEEGSDRAAGGHAGHCEGRGVVPSNLKTPRRSAACLHKQKPSTHLSLTFRYARATTLRPANGPAHADSSLEKFASTNSSLSEEGGRPNCLLTSSNNIIGCSNT